MSDQTREIHMQVMWNRLISVVEEQAMTLLRTAFSTSVREAGDLSAGVFDPEGRMLARLAQTRSESLLLVVSAPASPNRGTARFLREAAPLAARCALLLLGADDAAAAAPGAAVARWRQWLARS